MHDSVRHTGIHRSILTAVAVTLITSTVNADTAPSAEAVVTVIQTHCVGCHGSDATEAGIRLDQADEFAEFLQQRDQWLRVLEVLRDGSMPPEGEQQPSQKQRGKLIGWLESNVEQFDLESYKDPGPGMIWRLNRDQYNNTVQDLLGIDYDVASVVGIPEESTGEKFDTLASELEMSSLLMEKYVAATDKALDRVLSRAGRRNIDSSQFEPAPEEQSAEPSAEQTSETRNSEKSAAPKQSKQGLTLNHSGKISAKVAVDEAGTYEFRLRVDADRRPEVAISVNDVLVRRTHVPEAKPPRPQWLMARAEINEVQNDVVMTLELTNPDPDKGRSLTIHRMVVVGPVHGEISQPINSEARRSLLVARPGNGVSDLDAARQVIERFVTRAFRRPATDNEVERFLKLYELARETGQQYEPSIRLVARAVMLSPHFLFRIESDQAPPGSDRVYHITDYELASRLSYLLWSTMPDEELFELAAQGTLSNPDVLESQITRMIDHSKIDNFVTNFGGQWLGFREMDEALPDQQNFPRFTAKVQQAMGEETAALFRHVLRKNRSVTELLDADYLFLTEALAEHYFRFKDHRAKVSLFRHGENGNRRPNEMRRVNFEELKPKLRNPERLELRRGVLGQGSFLVLTSHPDRTAPSARGKWVLDRLLGTPPPPPPPNAGLFAEEDPDQAPPKDFREKLARHVSEESCANCHRKMDPIGFALEQFDAVGQWRDEISGVAIDTSGELPDGSKFNGVDEFREILLSEKQDLFVRNLVCKLLSYAIGRELTYRDEFAVQKIIRTMNDDELRFQTMLREVITSYPFLHRRNSASAGAVANVTN